MKDTILTGDMQALLPAIPTEAVDLVLTDPPYNIGYKGYDVHDDQMPDEEYIEMLCELQRFKRVVIIQYPEELMRLVLPSLGYPDHVGVWCYNSNLPRRFRLIAYYGVKPDYKRLRQPYKNPNDKRIKMLLENGSQGGQMYEWWDDIQLVKNVSAEKGSHPCPVPVKLMDRIIRLTTEPGDTVLDPFCGEGTTCVAAKGSGRHYIGIDISPTYAANAKIRLEHTQVGFE